MDECENDPCQRLILCSGCRRRPVVNLGFCMVCNGPCASCGDLFVPNGSMECMICMTFYKIVCNQPVPEGVDFLAGLDPSLREIDATDYEAITQQARAERRREERFPLRRPSSPSV